MAIHEMMVVTPELRAAIHENVDEQALERLVRQQHKALIKNGLQKVISGDTSPMRLCASPVPRWRAKHELSLSRHDPDGQKLQGIIDANDERQARLRLREEGLFLLDIRPQKVRE